MKSHHFGFSMANAPSILRSLGISVAAILVGVAISQALHYLYPEADLTLIDQAVITGASGFVVNLIKEFVRAK